MEFYSSSVSIKVLNDDEFTDYLAEKVPEIKKWLINKKNAVKCAVESAIKEHPDWFSITIFDLSFERGERNEKVPDFFASQDIKQGFTLLEAIA